MADHPRVSIPRGRHDDGMTNGVRWAVALLTMIIVGAFAQALIEPPESYFVAMAAAVVVFLVLPEKKKAS